VSRPTRLVLHIGQHKTGSKALQSFLAWNRRPLIDAGVFYPAEDHPEHGVQAYAVSQFRLYALARREATAALWGEDIAGGYWQHLARFCVPFDSPRGFFEWLHAEARRSDARQIVVSAEDFFDMHTAHETGFLPELIVAAAGRLAALAAEFGFEPRIVAYLRRQDHLLGAHYVQYIKGSADHVACFDEFARAFAPRLDARGVLRLWADAFGPDRVSVRLYERAALPGGIVPDFFENVLGIAAPDGCTEPPVDVESVNRSLGRDHVEFIRILNRRSTVGASVFAREAVLEAALHEDAPPAGTTGVTAWLSPADRRALLAAHDAGNAEVARDYLNRADGRLFREPWPEEETAWQPYDGLSPDRATAIALAVHQTIVARNPPTDEPARPPATPMPRPELARRRSAPARIVRRLRRAATRLGIGV